MPGFVKIPRDITNFAWYTDANTVKVYVHILMKASWTTRVWRGIVLQPGQVVISQETLAAELKLTRIKVRVALRNLIDCGIVAKCVASTVANGIASTVANGIASTVANNIANNIANRCTILTVYNSINCDGLFFDDSQHDSQQDSQQNTGSVANDVASTVANDVASTVANGIASTVATNIEYKEVEEYNIPPSNTLYYCPPKGESNAAAKGQISKSETIPVDTSTNEEKKKVPAKKKRSEERPKYVPIGQVAEWMKSNTAWLEAFCMHNHMDPEAVKRRIDEFEAHCIDNGETAKDKRDCIRHFNNWMRRMQEEPPRPRSPVGRVKHPAANFDNNQTFEEW